MGWPAICCPLAPRVGELLSWSRGEVCHQKAPSSAAPQDCCATTQVRQPSHIICLQPQMLSSPTAQPDTSPKLQWFCNINHQSRIQPGLRKPWFSSPAALLSQRHAVHTQGQLQHYLRGIWMKSVLLLLSQTTTNPSKEHGVLWQKNLI